MPNRSCKILISFFFFQFAGHVNAQNFYPEDITISNANGEPHDSLTFYFPERIQTDTGDIITGIDKYQQDWYSNSIRPMKVPILFNFYQGHDIYRFIWLRSFHPPMVFTLQKDGERIWLRSIKLDCIPRDMYIGYNIEFDPPKRKNKKNIGTTATSPIPSDSVEHIVQVAKILKDEAKLLTLEEWNNFKNLLAQCDYWKMKPTNNEFGFDGSRWIIEAHQKNRYWIVDRWAPKGNYEKCGEYLIKLSKFREKIY